MNTDTRAESTAGADVMVEQTMAEGREQVHADPATVQQLRPETLLMDANVRRNAQVDRAFVAAIRDHGVLQPIVAILTEGRQARVRYGHRRTLAAIAAELTTVPVIVHPGVDTADDAAMAAEEEADRLATQMVENTQRDGLSHAEQLDVFVGLAGLGLSAGQIATRTKAKRRDVADGLKAARTPQVREAVAAGLTLEQGAVLDEFADDPEAYALLLDKAQGGSRSYMSFDHLAGTCRHHRDDRAAKAAVTDELAAAGVTVVESPYQVDDPTARLTDLTNDPEPGHQVTAATRDEEDGDEDDEGPRGVVGQEESHLPAPITPEAHAACPGHAAFIGGHLRAGYRAVFVCTDPLRFGHRSRTLRELRTADPAAPRAGESTEEAAVREEAARATAKAARAQVIAGNKAWTAAEAVRREYLAEMLTRRTPPKGTGAFVAAALTADTHAISRAAERGHELAAELLCNDYTGMGQGGRDRVAKLLAPASDQRANVIALGLVLGAVEAGTGKHSWRQDHRIGGGDVSLVRYLRFLAACGYPLAPIERWAIGDDVTADEVFTPLLGRARDTADAEGADDGDDEQS